MIDGPLDDYVRKALFLSSIAF